MTGAGVTVPAPERATDHVVRLEDLAIEFPRRGGAVRAVDGVTLDVRRGEILGVVGESGCGKTLTALSIMRLLPEGARIARGRILLEGRDLAPLKPSELRRVRGREVAMVFQEPMASLDPAFTIGRQITEAIASHEDVSKGVARRRAVELLGRVGIPNPEARVDDYPHQFSGGMRQRAMIAIALSVAPKVLVADEPTTALDVTIQAQILELIAGLRDELGMSVVLITHSLAVVHEIADRVAVMYAGEIVETATVAEAFRAPRHPYTQGLLRSMPGRATRGGRLPVIPGRVPELWAKPPGCWFAPRCPNVVERCGVAHPELVEIAPDRELRCFNPDPDPADA